MESKQVKVICKECDSSRTIRIHKTPVGGRIDWLEDKYGIKHDIVSGRERLDGEFGFQCICGNNDLLTTQEAKAFTNPAAPSPKELDEVIKNLVPDQPKFELQEA